ncbi:FtsX-like permease family protein [Saccharothrix coeruleofusca]|uniref:ABC transporter permease n=1 Tax=Saccharothrix coeruleofusca TaxID=33919 RepID=A0A918ANU1_9PSEU|nr:FtsX-like permease family protein [Saccharothrix coeruleofusca]GGP55130.1 ABC transporter permease [Saccharothrix coeruleofusca]
MSVRLLALASIRHRWGGFAGVFVAVLCASALITALGVLFESGLRAGVAPQRYAGAAVVVGGRQAVPDEAGIEVPLVERVPLPADAVGRVAVVPGVDRAIGETAVPVVVPGAEGVRAHGWSSAALTPLAVREGAEPKGPRELVLDAGLADRLGVGVGDELPVAVGGVPERYAVTGVAAAPEGVRTGRQPALFLTDERARALAGRPDQVDVIGVLARPGVDPDELAGRIRAALPDLDVATHTGDDRGDAEFLDVGRARSELVLVSLSFAGTTLMISVLVVAGTLGLSIQQRKRELALLRAVAATPRQIHRLVGAEVLAVAGVAALLGVAPGYGVAHLLRSAFAASGLLPADFGLAIGPLPAVAAVLLVVATARVAGWVAARRAARTAPVEALREAAVEPARLGRVRVALGWTCAALGLGSAAVPLFLPGEQAVAGAAASALLLVLAAALSGPRLVVAAARLAGRPLRAVAPVGGHLAVASVTASARRLATVVTPLVLAVAVASVQIFTQTTVSAAAAEQADAGVVADVVVSGEAGLAPAVVDAVRATPGVRAATPVVRSQVLVRHLMAGEPQISPYAAQGLAVDGLDRTLDLRVSQGDLAELDGDAVALSVLAAETIGVGLGERIDLRLGDGAQLRPRVVALYGRGLGFGDVTLSRDVLAAHTTTRLDQSVLVRTDGTAELGALADRFPGVSVLDRAALSAAGQTQRDAQSWINLLALLVVLGYLAISVVNTLVMATVERSREFALLRLVGTGRRQVLRMTRIEALLVIGIAVVVGTGAAVPTLVGISLGLTGSPMPSAPPLVYLAIVGVTAVLGLLAIGIPTRVALRSRPVEVIGAQG